MDWTDLAQDKERWRAPVNTVMNLRVPWNAGIWLPEDLRKDSAPCCLVLSYYPFRLRDRPCICIAHLHACHMPWPSDSSLRHFSSIWKNTILSLWYAVFSIPRLQLPSCGRVFLQHKSTVSKHTQSAFFPYCQKLHELKTGKIKVLFLDRLKRDIQLWITWGKRLPNFFVNWNLIPTKHLMNAIVNSTSLCVHLKVNLVNLPNSA
jgi:hypothetical protein